MALSVTNVAGNPQTPGIAAEAYLPDQLIAGSMQLVTETVTITGGAALKRGSVLGKTNTDTAVAAAGTNTGNGVMGAVTASGEVLPGNYLLRVTKAVVNAGDFEVVDPQGDVIGIGAVGTAFNKGGLAFTLADGATDFVVGDSFTITVTQTAEKYKLSALAATDGSQRPCAILADDADASGGDVLAGVYLTGEFNDRAVTYGTNMTRAIAKDFLRRQNIHLKSTVSAADPT